MSDERFLSAARVEPAEWHARAVCSGSPNPDMFFPGDGGDYGEARKVCASCPVAGECLDEALRRREQFGIWGGLTTNERNQLKGERQ